MNSPPPFPHDNVSLGLKTFKIIHTEGTENTEGAIIIKKMRSLVVIYISVGSMPFIVNRL